MWGGLAGSDDENLMNIYNEDKQIQAAGDFGQVFSMFLKRVLHNNLSVGLAHNLYTVRPIRVCPKSRV